MAEFHINIIEDHNISIITDNQFKISQSFVDIALNSHGHWDIYFAPFVLDKFGTTIYYRYIYVEENDHSIISNYSNIFTQLYYEFKSSLKTFSENWYENQL